MELLQLVESRNSVGLVFQLLDSLAQSRFQFQILLEVVITILVVYFNNVIEAFGIRLVFAPQLVGIFL